MVRNCIAIFDKIAKSAVVISIWKYNFKLCFLRFRRESLSTNSSDFIIKLRTWSWIKIQKMYITTQIVKYNITTKISLQADKNFSFLFIMEASSQLPVSFRSASG